MRTLRWAGLVVLVGSLFALTGCLFDPEPVADFTWSPQDPIARSEVQFFDESEDSAGLWQIFGVGGIKRWTWDFDDSETNSSDSPEHEFAKSGSYKVQLTVEDGSGATDTETKTVNVDPSLHGTWSGTLDNNGFPLALTFFIQHSASGGILGTLSWGGATFAIMSAALVGNQVTFTVTGSGIFLHASGLSPGIFSQIARMKSFFARPPL